MNQFSRNSKPRFVELILGHEQTRHECENLGRIWIERQLAKGNDTANNLIALRRLFEDASLFDLLAIGVYVGSDLKGFSVNEFNHGSYVACLFEQMDTSQSGIGASLRKEVATRLKARTFKWWNMQQDMGIPGLRTSKKRYHPSHFLKKLIIQQAMEPRGAA